MKNEIVNLGGRPYVAIGESTIEHDTYTLGCLRRAGLLPLHGKRPDQTPADYAEQIICDVMASGEMFDLLGGLLIPSELRSEDWTPHVARETAGELRHVAGDEKRKLRNLIVSVLLDFFRDGIASSLTSRTSSAASRGGRGTATGGPFPGTNGMDHGASSFAN